MAPQYQVEWSLVGAEPVGMMRDRTSKQRRWLAIAVVALLLLAGVWLGSQRWAASGPVLRQQAQAAMDKNDLAGAEAILTEAVAADPTDLDNHYALGVVQAQLGKLPQAAASLEMVLTQTPDQVDSELMLGLVYAEQGRASEASCHVGAVPGARGDRPARRLCAAGIAGFAQVAGVVRSAGGAAWLLSEARRFASRLSPARGIPAARRP